MCSSIRKMRVFICQIRRTGSWGNLTGRLGESSRNFNDILIDIGENEAIMCSNEDLCIDMSSTT